MPAAKSTGRVRTAYQGRLAAAAPPAMTSSPTSVTVSKPRPKSSPTGYMCHGLRHGPRHAAEDPVEEAALVELALELGLVEVARAHPAEDLEDADERGEVDAGR